MACRRRFRAARCYAASMMEQPTAMHVARIRSSHTGKDGQRREYESRLLRRTYRDGDKVRHETIANMSKMPDSVVDAVEAALKGEVLVPAGRGRRSRSRGRCRTAMSPPPGRWPGSSGCPPCSARRAAQRDLALALVISRVAHPGSKLSTIAWWHDVTLGADLGIEDATTDEAYAAMDWLQARQDAIERKLARRHLAPEREPVADGAVRPVVLLAGGLALPARGARLLPRRQERQGADRVRAAHRPRGPAGRDPGPRGEHRRPRRVHRDRRRRARTPSG